MKVYGVSNKERVFLVIMPILLIIPVMLFADNNEVFLKPGYLIFFILFIGFNILNIRLNLLDWNVYIFNKRLFIKRLFSKEKEIEEGKKINITPIFLLSMSLKIFKLNVKGSSYLFKYNEKISTMNRFFNLEKISRELEERIRYNLSDVS